ncbi:MAG: hypothetical protein ABR507_02560 [Actinomycetota bacterium]
MNRSRRSLVVLAIVLSMFSALTARADDSKKPINKTPAYGRGESCTLQKDNLPQVSGGYYTYKCYQDNNKAKTGVNGAFGPVCASELVFACQAHYGNLIVGGWEFLYGDGLIFGVTPNTWGVNVQRSSSYIEVASTKDQTFTATATVAGAFFAPYGPHTRMCLEVYDWGLTTIYRVYNELTLVGRDCIRPGDPTRTSLTVKGNAFYHHRMWVVGSLHNEEGDGGAHFVVEQLSHNIY